MSHQRSRKDSHSHILMNLQKKQISRRFNPEAATTSKEWLFGFLTQHPDLLIRQPTSRNIAHAVDLNGC